jgi:hypothetical protein
MAAKEIRMWGYEEAHCSLVYQENGFIHSSVLSNGSLKFRFPISRNDGHGQDIEDGQFSFLMVAPAIQRKVLHRHIITNQDSPSDSVSIQNRQRPLLV